MEKSPIELVQESLEELRAIRDKKEIDLLNKYSKGYINREEYLILNKYYFNKYDKSFWDSLPKF